MKKILFALYSLMFFSTAANAEVTLLDKDNWKVTATGFAEFDMTYDTVRGFNETVGNNPVSINSYSANTHSFQESVRNSRLGFGFEAPKTDDWKTRGYFELDFLGTNASPSAAASESNFFSNGSVRVRHVYLAAEKNNLQILTGQTWSLLGWQSTFVPTTLSVAPVSGILYQRTAQAQAMKTMEVGTDQKVYAALSIERAAQRDSGTPNLNLGLKWTNSSRKSALNGTYADAKLQPMTVALSGTVRRFTAPTSSTSVNSHNTYTGGAIAADILIPILAADESGSVTGTLTLTGEFSAGKGYGDEFPGWSGNYQNLTSTVNGQPNLDAGIGGFDSNNDFQLIQLQSWNLQLQYHLSEISILDAGTGTLHSTNVKNLTGTLSPTSGTNYDRATSYFVNYLYDFTKQWRIGAEFDVFQTHYTTDQNATDRRFMVSSNYRF